MSNVFMRVVARNTYSLLIPGTGHFQFLLLTLIFSLFFAVPAFAETRQCYSLFSTAAAYSPEVHGLERPRKVEVTEVRRNSYDLFNFSSSIGFSSSRTFTVRIDGKSGLHHEITVMVPNLRGWVDQNASYIASRLRSTIGDMPIWLLKSLKVIIVNPTDPNPFTIGLWRNALSGQPLKGVPAGVGAPGTLELYPSFFNIAATRQASETLAHELFHLVAYALSENAWRPSPEPPREYIEAARADSFSVSKYAEADYHSRLGNHWAEDFAEAGRLYVTSDAGTLVKHRALYPNRFAEIDRIVLHFRNP